MKSSELSNAENRIALRQLLQNPKLLIDFALTISHIHLHVSGASKSMEEFNISWNHLLTKATIAFAESLKVWKCFDLISPMVSQAKVSNFKEVFG